VQRIPEPELMLEEDQVRAYAEADFEEPHGRFISLFQEVFPEAGAEAKVLDLGCGSGDIARRFAKACPEAVVDALDGSPAMLRAARKMTEGISERVRFIECRLPLKEPLFGPYDLVVSNSLLHHLEDPGVLWRTIAELSRPGARIFVQDLMRPGSVAEAAALTELYAGGEPDVLRRDFYNSLCAAYRPGEVRLQLEAAGLGYLSLEVVSDRHLIVWGRVKTRDATG